MKRMSENAVGCGREDCSHCPSHSDEGRREPTQGTVSGGRLALAAVVIFLLPLGLAIAGGLVADALGSVAALGAVVGALAGVAIAVAARRVVLPVGKEAP
jgi:hypothetical protein